MKTEALSKKFYIIATACACLIIAGLCYAGYVNRDGDREPSEEEIEVVHVSGTLVAMDQEDLMEQATLVIRGKVAGQSDAFRVSPVFGGDPTIFTDYYVEVYEVLRGDSASPSDTITVRIQGGTVDNLRVIAEEAAELNADDEVLLYLYTPGMGSGYNTEGDYYYIVGVNQGAYVLDESSEIMKFSASDDESFVNKEGEKVDFQETKEEVENFSEIVPVDEDAVYNDFLETCNKNLKSGFITQEEYDRLLAETREYATIID